MDLEFTSLGGKRIRLELDTDDGDEIVSIDPGKGDDDFIIPSGDVSKLVQWLSETRNVVSRT